MWIGAACEDGRGAYVYYFGAKDKRNKSVLCDTKHHVPDLEYVFTLATVEILERNRFSDKFLFVYHGSRNLKKGKKKKIRIFSSLVLVYLFLKKKKSHI